MRIADGQRTENTWDYRNRLTRIVMKDAQGNILKEQRNTYDVNNRRIGVWEDADGSGPAIPTQRWTVYDGVNPYADFNGTGSLTTRYLYGPAIDQLFGRWSATGGEVDWYLGDILGSVRQVVKADGTVLDNITYDSFGKILVETHAENGDRFKYTGREWDVLFEQYYYRARYYSPDIGRFVSEDPWKFSAGDSNLYRYTGNSPIGRRDPSGLRYIDGQWVGTGPEPALGDKPDNGPVKINPGPVNPPRPDDGRLFRDTDPAERVATVAAGVVVLEILLADLPKDVYLYGMSETTNVLSQVGRSILDSSLGKHPIVRKLSCRAIGIMPTPSLGGVIARWGTPILRGTTVIGWTYVYVDIWKSSIDVVNNDFPPDMRDRFYEGLITYGIQ